MTMSSIKILEPTSARSNDELNGSTQNLSMTLIGSTLSNKGEINKKVSSFQKALDKISYQNESNGSGREISGSSISCVITLCKVLDNILLERQYNSKTRSIKLGNKLFRERVGSVPGGVDLLLACNFTYTTIQSKNSVKKKSNGSTPANAIKLTKDKEDRDLLVAARRYMHDYGQRVLLLKPGKHRNELPPYVIHDKIAEETIRLMRESINSAVVESGGCIENLDNIEDLDESQSIDDQSYSLDESSISYSLSTMGTSNSRRNYDLSGSGPPSPVTICTVSEVNEPDDVSLSSAFTIESERSNCLRTKQPQPSPNSNRSPDSVITPEIPTFSREKLESPAKDDASIKEKSYRDDSMKEQIQNEEATTKQISSNEQIQNEEVTTKQTEEVEAYQSSGTFVQLNESLEVRLDKMGINRGIQKTRNELSNFTMMNTDDQSLGVRDNVTRSEALSLLSAKDKEALSGVSRVDIVGKDKDDKILSIALGRESISSSCRGTLVRKLSKLAMKQSHSKQEHLKDCKTAASTMSHSVIRIQNSDGLSIQPGIAGDKRRRKTSIQSQSTNVASNITAKITFDNQITGNERTIVEIGINLFFAIFATTFGGDIFLTDEQLQCGDISRRSDIGPYIPIEIIYKLWATLLRSERAFNSICGRDVYFKFTEIAKSQNTEIRDEFLLSSLSESDTRACKFILYTLKKSQLVTTIQLCLGMEHMGADKKNANFRIGIAIKGENSKDFGLSLARERLDIKYENNALIKGQKVTTMKKLQNRCHSIISRSMTENVDLDSKGEIFIDGQGGLDILSTWYILRWLPCHMLSAEMSEDAVLLLHDQRYLRHRLEIRGLHLGTLQYIQECRVIRTNPQDLETLSSSGSVSTSDFGSRATKAIHDALLSYLNEKGKELSSNLESPQCNDLAQALHSLGVAKGELGNIREEIDVLNEALRFKIVSDMVEESSAAETYLHLGACYHAIGDPSRAITSYSEALSINTHTHGQNFPGLSRILYQMGVIYCEQGDLESAKERMMMALSISKKQIGSPRTGEDTAKIYSWLGNIQRNNGHRSSALDYFQKALKSMESSVGRNHLEVAEIMQNIGIIFDDCGENEKSLKAFYECLRIRRNLLDDELHNDICDTVACMANTYRRIDVDKSLRLFRIVLNAKAKIPSEIQRPRDLLQIYEDMLAVAKVKLERIPADDILQVEVATLYFRIGSIYERLERLVDAAESYVKALRIHKIKGNYHDIGDLLNSLGIIHAKRRSYRRAMKCFNDSLKVRTTVMGPHHEDVGETLHNMGNCAAKQMDYDKALECYEKSLIIKRLTYGECSVASANTLQNIGYVNEKLGLLDHSLNYYKDALAVRSMLLGEMHIDVAFSLHSIGLIYKKTDKLLKAADCLERSLLLKRKHYIGGQHISVADTMNQLAMVYISMKKTKEAIHLFEKTLCIFEKKLGAHISTATVLDSLGSASLSLGNLEAAYSYLERSLALRRLIQGDDDIDTSNTQCLLGKVQSQSGDLDDALITFKSVLRLRKSIFGNETIEVAAVINDVGVIQLRLGHHGVAENCFREAERVWRMKPEECSEYLGETLVNLGEIYHINEKFDDAISNFTEAMGIFESAYGTAHVAVALTLYKLGRSQREKHDLDAAMMSFEKSLSIRTNDLGDDSSMTVAEVLKDIGSLCLVLGDLVTARNYLGEALKIMKLQKPKGLITADALYEQGKVMLKLKYRDEAFEAFNEALRIKRSRFDEDDATVADILSEIGLIYEDMRKWSLSLNHYRQALKIREKLLVQNELIANSHFSIGTILQTTQKHHEAISSYGSALVAYQKVLGDDHLTCAKTMNNIGIVYEAIDELDEALKYHTEALRIRKMHLGKDHIKVANSLDNIAGIYQRQNQSTKALKSLKESLKIRSRFGNDNLDVATTLFGMGIIYCDQKDVGRAMECYEAALKIRKRRKGPHDIDVAKTLHNIGSLYALKQDYKKALSRWREALDIYRETLDDDHHMIACTLGNIKMAENMLEEDED